MISVELGTDLNHIYGNLVGMVKISMKEQSWCSYDNDISSDKGRGLVSLSWSGLIGQGSWFWYSSIGISIRIILYGFSSPRGRGFGLGRMPTSCVLVFLFLVAI